MRHVQAARRTGCARRRVRVRSSGHLRRLLDDVLDLSKVEAKRLGIEISSVDLPSLVREVAGIYGSKAKEKLLGFEVHFGEGAECRLISDETRLRQILINLVSNAIKYTQKGQVQIKMSVDSEEAGLNRCYRVAVHDTGIGIATEKITDLFQPFNQVHDRKYQAQGSGLGLAFSFRLTELIGGKLEVESELGRGSCFTLSIPYRAVESSSANAETLAEADPVSQQVEDYNAIQFNGLRLLIAEDNPDNQEVFLHMLKPHGLAIDIVNNGREAVDRLEANIEARTPYDLVLMDMQMPILDGYEATREIRFRGHSIPIIALTAYAMEEDKQRCLDIGCSDFQSKPVLRRDLLHAISRTIERFGSARAGATVGMVASAPSAGPAVNIDGFRRLVERYLQSLKGYLSIIESAEVTEDLSELRVAVHRIRGTAANYGFDQISKEAGRCDQILRHATSLSEARQPLERLKEELRQVVS